MDADVMELMRGAGLANLMYGGDAASDTSSEVSSDSDESEGIIIRVPSSKVRSTDYEEQNMYVMPQIPRNDPLIKELLAYMEELDLPVNKARANSGVGKSQTIGKVRQRFKTTYNDSAFTRKHPELKRILWALGKKYNPLPFTSVQVNHNYEATPHIDKNNIGLSFILAIGDYDGGDLIVKGEPHNIAYHPLIFNGAKNLHSVSKIRRGDRYSFVFFKTGKRT